MKKILSIACVAIVVAALASCKKTYVSTTPNQTYNVTITPSQWTQTKDGKSDSVSIQAPDIDNYFNNNGATLVYFSFFSGVYEQIPEVFNGNSYSYFHYTGNLVLYSQPIAGGTPVKPVNNILVKLVLIPAN